MLFWLFVIILMIGISLVVVEKMVYNHKGVYLANLEEVGKSIVLVSAIVLAIMIVILCCQYIGVDAMVEKNLEIYNAIEYKVTSGACRDEFGLLSKEVIDEVQNWNKDVKYYQAMQDDFWIGIFYPNVFDQFETIDYMSYNTGD